MSLLIIIILTLLLSLSILKIALQNIVLTKAVREFQNDLLNVHLSSYASGFKDGKMRGRSVAMDEMYAEKFSDQ